MTTFSTPIDHRDILVRQWDNDNGCWTIDRDAYVPAAIVRQARRYMRFGLIPSIWAEPNGAWQLRLVGYMAGAAWAYVNYDYAGNRIGSYLCGPYFDSSHSHDYVTRRLREQTRFYGWHVIGEDARR